MAALLLHDHAKRTGALRKHTGKRACPCCANFGSTKNGGVNRSIARRQARRIEDRQWRKENQ